MSKFIIMYTLGFVVMLSAGCQTSQGSNANIVVNLTDGLNTKEAEFLAKENLTTSGFSGEYKIKTAKVLADPYVKAHPDFYFVMFEAKKFEMNFWRYLVVLHKKTGEIYFSNPYETYGHINYDWIFKQ